ncbi:peptidoglycan DD-metalloendopeptidase family protein [Marinitoga arctica]
MKKLLPVILLIILFLNSCSLFQNTPTITNDRVDKIEQEIALLKLSLNNQEKKLELLNKKSEDLSSKISNLEKDIDFVFSSIEASNSKTSEKLLSYKTELTNINKSIDLLKKQISDLKTVQEKNIYTDILNSMENRISDIEKNIYTLDNETLKKDYFYNISKKFITKDSTFILNLQNEFYSSLNSSITAVESLIEKKYYNIDNNIVDITDKISTLEKNYNSLTKEIDKISNSLYTISLGATELKNTIDQSVKSNLDNLLKTVNSLDKIWQINFETLEKDLDTLKNDYSQFKDLTSGIINEENLKKYVYQSVETETQREVAKLFYKTKSEELLKIKNLEENLDKLDKNMKNLQNSFELLSSRPPNTIDEKYKSKLEELERELTNALISFSNAEIKNLFGSSDQIIYQVKSGDTLSQIALTFGLGYNGIDLIKVANNIDDPRTIRVGQKLIIPVNNIENFLRWPLNYTNPSDYERIVIRFGDRISTGISVGLGILPLKDEAVYPALPGRVIDTGKYLNNSFYIKIDHGSGVISVYSNLFNINVKTGKWVDSETILGNVKKDKLFNFEIWKNGEPKDPMKLFFKYLGNFKATFYTEWDDKIIYYPAFRLTKSQNVPRPWVTVAADPNFLPLGTVVYIPEFRNSPNFGFFEIEDIGSKIVGNRLDIYINDVRLAQNTQNVSVYIVGKKNRR